MLGRAILGAALCPTLSSCTHSQPARSMVLATGTVMDIQYRTMRNNLALPSCHPDALPSHIDLADGVVQVTNGAAFGTSGGFTALAGDFGIERYGPSGSRACPSNGGRTRSPTSSG